MHWGDAQSMFQIMLALNLAYFSFRQIRVPALERKELADQKQREVLDAAGSRITEIEGDYFRDRGLVDLAISHAKGEIDVYMMSDGVNSRLYSFTTKSYEDSLDKWIRKCDSGLAFLSLLISLVPLTCLIYATLHYEHHLSRSGMWLYMIVGLLPSVFCVVLNIAAVANYRRRTLDQWSLDEIEMSIHLSKFFGNEALRIASSQSDATL